MEENKARLIGESRRCKRKRSREQFFFRFTRLAIPGTVLLLTLSLLSRFLWPFLLYSLWAVPMWILGVALFLLLQPGLWAVPSWKADALVDLKSGSRGLFMALREAQGRDWPESLGRVLVRVKVAVPWKGLFQWFASAGALLAVLVLPDMRFRNLQTHPAITPLSGLEEMVASLKEEQLADREELERIEEILEKMEEEASGSLRAEDWQALDGLREELERQTADTFRRLMETQGELAGLKSVLRKKADLSGQIEKIAGMLGQMTVQEASDFCAQAAASLGTNPEDLKRLVERCRQADLSGLREGNFSSFSEEELALLNAIGQKMELSSELLKKMAQILEKMDLKALAKECNLTEGQLAKLLSMCKGGVCNLNDADLERLIALLEAAEKDLWWKCACCSELLKGKGT